MAQLQWTLPQNRGSLSYRRPTKNHFYLNLLKNQKSEVNDENTSKPLEYLHNTSLRLCRRMVSITLNRLGQCQGFHLIHPRFCVNNRLY